MLISRFNQQGWWWCQGLASQTNILVGGRSVWACFQPGLWDVSCIPRLHVNLISETAAPHLRLHHPTTAVLFCKQNRQGYLSFPWHELSAKSFAGCAIISLYLRGFAHCKTPVCGGWNCNPTTMFSICVVCMSFPLYHLFLPSSASLCLLGSG